MKRILEKFCDALVLLCLSVVLSGCDLLPELSPPEESVSGTIRMSANLPVKAWRTRTLFIIVEREGGGPPLAVQRLVETRFPYQYVITKDDMMIRGQKFAGNVRVRARLDADGVPGKLVQGDYEGRTAGVVTVGAKNVDVVIDRIGTAPPPKVAKKSPPRTAPPPKTAPPAEEGGKTIRGVVRVAPGLKDKAKGKAAIFIIARGSRPGPPLAVMRILNPSFPLEFTMSEQNVMMQGVAFEGEVSLIAKLDGDGKVGTEPGDIFGGARGPVQVGARGVEIVLSQEAKGEAAPKPATREDTGEVISGTIEIAPALRAKAAAKPVLFLIARKGGGGPPLAVVRVANPRFPLAFEISKRNVMIPGVPFEGVVTLSARLDADGSAGPASAGDLEGRTAQPVRVGAKDVRIVIDRAF